MIILDGVKIVNKRNEFVNFFDSYLGLILYLIGLLVWPFPENLQFKNKDTFENKVLPKNAP